MAIATIDYSLTFYSFLSETGTVNDYSELYGTAITAWILLHMR